VRLDLAGVLTASGGLFCLVYGLANAEMNGWSTPLTVVLLALSAVLVAGFVVAERVVPEPLLPLRVVADRRRGSSYLSVALAFTGMFGAFLFLTYYLQQDLAYSPLKTGAAFLPMTAGIMVAAGSSTVRLLPRFGPRPLVPTGFVIGAGAMVWLAQLSPGSTYAGGVLVPIFLLGLGIGLAFAPSINTATAGIAHADAGVGSAMVNTSQQVGGAVGTAVLSTVFSSAVTSYLTSHRPGPQLISTATIHGYAVAFAVCAGIFATGAVLSVALLPPGRGEP
jgi:predicted MFS family arabinose efflux permease